MSDQHSDSYEYLVELHKEHHQELAALRARLDKAMEGLRSFAHEGNWDFYLKDGPIWIAPFDPTEAAANLLAELEAANAPE